MKVGDEIWWVVWGHGYNGVVTAINADGWTLSARQTGGPFSPRNWTSLPSSLAHRIDNDLHVLPVHDLREHVEDVTCWCLPTAVREPGHAAVIVHHSQDGRELVEEHGVN